MKNLYVLPTSKPSRFYYHNDNSLKFILDSILFITSQNIHITSDEEIKEDDWVLSKLNEVILFGRNYNSELYKKIILTTDQYLIGRGVQAISNEFLEWFIKNPSCEEVEFIYGFFNTMGRQVNPNALFQNHSQCVWKYKIIIPNVKSYDDFIKGADKYKERSYSEEELFTLTLEAVNIGMSLRQEQLNGWSDESGNDVHKVWFEQFKK
tara:strand:+ start:136 stop:759 length:624 start_codon:yes stop_codon:yes gene_type:complete